MLQFFNEIPIYLFDREQAAFNGLSRSQNVDCRVTKAAILQRAKLLEANAVQLIAALISDRGYFEGIAQAIHARDSGSFVMIDSDDLGEVAAVPA